MKTSAVFKFIVMLFLGLLVPLGMTSCASWRVSGNSGTNPSSDFLGTTDSQPLVIKANSSEAMRIDPLGNVGIGTPNPNTILHIDGTGVENDGSTAVVRIISGNGAQNLLLDGNEIDATADGLFLNNNTDQNVILATGGGRVGIGTTSPSSNAKLTAVEINPGRIGILGQSTGPSGDGVVGESSSGHGVKGTSDSHIGAEGTSNNGTGVFGESISGRGVWGTSTNGTGVYGQSTSGQFIFEGWQGFVDRRFAVERATGNVLADGSFIGPADFAEMLPSSDLASNFEDGDVLIINSDGKLAKATKPYATNLIGVYSGKPGFLGDMRVTEHGIEVYGELKDKWANESWLPVAMMGIVPVRVSAENAPIKPGDLLTTSAVKGHAKKAEPVLLNDIAIYPNGTILGKALEPLSRGTGLIKVLVMLR